MGLLNVSDPQTGLLENPKEIVKSLKTIELIIKLSFI
jgi:hypothetical protein